VLLSKADQLQRAQSEPLLRETLAHLQGIGSAQLFSARSGLGVEAARARLDAWLKKESPDSPLG
jgi:hypothetical protein